MIELKRRNGELIASCDVATLCEAVFTNKKDLIGADLRYANLIDANLIDANLRCANLSGADLRCANLSGANLRNTNLRCANLGGADLIAANLSGASNIISVGPIGREGRLIYAVRHDLAIMVQAGCFWGTIDELSAKVNGTHGGNAHSKAYRSAIEFIKAYAEAYQWSEVKDQ